ncbi:glycosaminoglycan xylosylkinase homolog isoform X1 [Vanessa cardui]|uniref:glycosaminoglycan xylosylkinase homolog isoform X1 n=1 Tax=Vanessa cardui TaxID=171605 RepID=UPI001F13C828|nr:glycosaminoglycan xylosylkinase homolog isoform X1 [Vanessa cardui]
MSMNYAFGFSLFLLVLVALNIFFFYTLNTVGLKSHTFNVPSINIDLTPSVFKEIYDYLNYLPNQYKSINSKFALKQKNLISSFNTTKNVKTESIWSMTENWISEDSLFPHENGAAGKILHAIQTTQIALVDNAPKGTQLKLLLLLEGKQKIFFKPKRYNLNHVVNGNIYAGFDRHNSEVFAYYLAMVLNFRWIAPSIIRRIHLHRDIVPFATMGLKKSMIKNESGSLCIYGKCFYCRKNETVCPDQNGEIEGAAILYLDKQFKIHKSPWRRSYSNRKMEWEIDNAFCKKVKGSMSTKLLLNLIDVAIFDFLIQNGDRHRFEVYKDQIILLDNGKGLGNPAVDELDILAPLYQCCMISPSTWQKLEIVSGGSLTNTIKQLAALQGQKLATEEHFKAVERRLLKVYATVQYCIGKYSRAKVLKNWLA